MEYTTAIRLKDKSYIDDRYTITENDTKIKIELTKARLKKFHNPELKLKYKYKKYIKLRIITITLENGTTEILLTNIFDKNFKIVLKNSTIYAGESKPTTTQWKTD